MRALAFDEIEALLQGALGVERNANSLTPLRLPAWAFAQSPDPALTMMARMASGVRLAFVTDADAVELEVEDLGVRVAGEERRPANFDALVDGVRVARHAGEGPSIVADLSTWPPGLSFDPGRASTLRLNLPAGSGKQVTIWLAQTAAVKLLAMRVPAGAQIAALPRLAKSWIHYGSSISHTMEAAGPSEIWAAQAAQQLGLDLTNLGLAGQCHVDGFIARVIAEARPDFVSLKLGINVVNLDSMRERAFRPAVQNFLDILRERAAQVPVLIVSPIVCPIAEDAPGPTLRDGAVFRAAERPPELAPGALSLSRIRAILEEIAVARRQAGDGNLHYLDGREIFGRGADDLNMLPDGLHPDAAAQAPMAARFAAAVRRLGILPPPP